MNKVESSSLPFDYKAYSHGRGEFQEMWDKGYWQGYDQLDKINPCKKDRPTWEAFEAGYEEGWLDS